VKRGNKIGNKISTRLESKLAEFLAVQAGGEGIPPGSKSNSKDNE